MTDQPGQNNGDNRGGNSAADGSAPAGRRRWTVRLIAVFLSLAIPLVLVESALRLFVPVRDVPHYFWDPVIGTRVLPNLEGRYVGAGGIDTRYRFNEQGWNHPENYTIEKPEGTVRICVLGDSYVEALQVPIEQSLTLVGQREMNDAGVPAQWYAFARSGLGLSSYYLLLHHYVMFYKPDAVVILLVSNDVYDSSPHLASRDRYLNLIHVDETGETQLIEAPRFVSNKLRRLAYSTATCRYFFAQLGLHRDPPGVRELYIQRLKEQAERGQLVMGEGLTIDQRGAMSWRHAEDLLRLIRDRCRALNVPLLLAYCGNGPKIHAAYEKSAYEPAPREEDPYCLGVRAWHLGEDLFAPVAARLDIPYLDLTDPIADEVRQTGRRHDFAGDEHYNDLAHRVAGEVIARRVAEMLSGADKP